MDVYLYIGNADCSAPFGGSNSPFSVASIRFPICVIQYYRDQWGEHREQTSSARVSMQKFLGNVEIAVKVHQTMETNSGKGGLSV